MKTRIFFLIALVIFNTYSCKDKEKKSSPLIESNGLVSDAYIVKTGQLVTVNVPEGVDIKDQYIGTIDQVPIDIFKETDTTVFFIIPSIESGTYVFEFDLGQQEYEVTKLFIDEPDAKARALTKRLEERIKSSFENSEISSADFTRATTFKNELLSVIESMNADDLQMMMTIYESNKRSFQLVSESIRNLMDGSVVMYQSDCPRSDFLSFYSCTANNIATSLNQLTKSIANLSKYLIAAGLATMISPLNLGLSIIGAGFAVALAAEVFFAEIAPELYKLINETWLFLKANWVLATSTFDVVKSEFVTGESTSTEIQPTFETFQEEDNHVAPELYTFTKAYNALKSSWNKIKNVSPAFPVFSHDEETADLNSGELTITEISNPDVELDEIHRDKVTFINKGEDPNEDFSFVANVEKEGQSVSKLIYASVSKEKGPIAGNWSLTFHAPNFGGIITYGTVVNFGSGLKYGDVFKYRRHNTQGCSSNWCDVEWNDHYEQRLEGGKLIIKIVGNGTEYEFNYDPNAFEMSCLNYSDAILSKWF